MRKIDIIRSRRANHFVMQRLRRAREIELQRDVKEVQRDMSLIRSPAVGLKERRAQEEREERERESGIVEEIHESDVEMEEESDIEEVVSESDEAPELVEAL